MNKPPTIKQRAELFLSSGLVNTKEEAFAKAQLESSAQRLEVAKRKIKKIESAKRRQEIAKSRNIEARRLILIGRTIEVHIKKLSNIEAEKLNNWLKSVLNAYLTKDSDRVLFGFNPKQRINHTGKSHD